MASDMSTTDPHATIELLPSSPYSAQTTRHQSHRGGRPEFTSSSHRIRSRYKSAFTEIGLDETPDPKSSSLQDDRLTRPGSRVRWRSQVEIHEMEQQEDADVRQDMISRTTPATTWHQHGSSAAILSRLSFLAVVFAIMIPVLHMSPLLNAGPAILGAEAGPIAPNSLRNRNIDSTRLLSRQTNAADVCLRWSQQSAVVNGTLYLYGGRTKSDSNQASDTWSEWRPILHNGHTDRFR